MKSLTICLLLVAAFRESVASHVSHTHTNKMRLWEFVLHGGDNIFSSNLQHNHIIKCTLKQDFPGPSIPSSSSSVSRKAVEPMIKMPTASSSSSSSSSSRFKKKKRLFHTRVTASDWIYSIWQFRVMHYWFKKHKDKPNSEMGGFTRILHSGHPGRFKDEIPTFVA